MKMPKVIQGSAFLICFFLNILLCVHLLCIRASGVSYFQVGDLNYDGTVNTTDVVTLRRYIAGGYGIDLTPPSEDCAHSNFTTIPAITPTCTVTGLTEGQQCTDCGVILVQQEYIPANGHNYIGGLCTLCGTPETLPSPSIEMTGSTFMSYDKNEVAKSFDECGVTYEAWIKFPKNIDLSNNRGGIILGNYGTTSNTSFSFEIDINGKPKLYQQYSANNTKRYSFNYDVRTGEWLHLTIVNDYQNSVVLCYIDGELVDQLNESWHPVKTDVPALVGNDYRFGEVYYFKGELHSIAVYSDVRTDNEIHADMKADISSIDKENLIAAWDLSAGINGAVTDLSENGYTVESMWIKEKESVDDYSYSFVAVGDTQSVNIYDPEHFSVIYDWIVDNKDTQKIKYVMGLGDITDKDQNAEWERAASAFQALDEAGIEYSIVRGNHDGSVKFNNYLDKAPYNQSFDGRYGNTLENTYRKITVNGIQYLIFTLDFGAQDDVLNWASGVIEANRDHNVIITTHAYLFRDGSTLDAGDVCPPTQYHAQNNNGDHMWNKLISRHENIVLVLSGHDPHPSVVCTQTKGEKGNTVTQILTDHQYVDRDLHNADMDTTGMVTILHFSEDGKTVTVECYSTVYGAYYGRENQFTFELNVIQ